MLLHKASSFFILFGLNRSLTGQSLFPLRLRSILIPSSILHLAFFQKPWPVSTTLQNPVKLPSFHQASGIPTKMHGTFRMSHVSLAMITLLLPAALAFPQAAGGGSKTTLAPSTTVVSSPAICTSPSFPPIRCKRGTLISGNYADALVAAFSNSPKICWTSNWYSAPFKNIPSSVQFVPQDYGKDSNLDGTWTKNADTAIKNGATHFLGFGEPHTDGSLHMEPQEAVNLWMKDLQPYTCKVNVGAPSIVQNGRDWLIQFLDLCATAGCRIGFITCHWYWRADQFEDFKSNVLKCIDVANGRWPVWIANFQPSGDAAAQKAFIAQALPWLEAQDPVKRYAMVNIDKGPDGFLDSSGTGLSDLGAYYANF